MPFFLHILIHILLLLQSTSAVNFGENVSVKRMEMIVVSWTFYGLVHEAVKRLKGSRFCFIPLLWWEGGGA